MYFGSVYVVPYLLMPYILYMLYLHNYLCTLEVYM